jgi:hypothetical protein
MGDFFRPFASCCYINCLTSKLSLTVSTIRNAAGIAADALLCSGHLTALVWCTNTGSTASHIAVLCRAKGGIDLAANARLKTVILQARGLGVPSDIIDRNLKKATDNSAPDLTEHFIEVYGPGGSGFIMDCFTDNKQRAANEIWTVVKRLNGKVEHFPRLLIVCSLLRKMSA